jgi:sterol desaturase/sphingolipid hydroxylase (fatty acid hydroxylase superfamily)
MPRARSRSPPRSGSAKHTGSRADRYPANQGGYRANNKSWWWWWPDNLAGVSNRGLFGTGPPWSDTTKPPGFTSQADVLSLRATLLSIATGKFFVMSPHLSWCAIAMAMHWQCPYDVQAAKVGWSLSWAAPRFALNFSVAFAYYGYFYYGLFIAGWAGRKYLPGVYPTRGNMMHNLWYWLLGVVQWTAWECVMMRLWATGKVPFVTDAQLLTNHRALALNVAVVLVTPIWRDVHFYIAHRFLHVRAIYKYVHALHHRNQDPEPFSGMCMHPIEHCYYFSNVWIPALYLSNLNPFAFLFCFVHLTLAPGCGHSGWEDHFQSDQYHYLHHAKFECNYGSPFSACIDQGLGTFREGLGKSSAYRGEWSESKVKTQRNAESTPGQRGVWSEQSYLGLPQSTDHAIYTLFWLALWPLVVWGAVFNHGETRVEEIAGVTTPTFIASVVAYAPVALALALAFVSGDRMSWRWPFHRERLLGTLGLFLALGYLVCMLPVYHATKWICDA